MKIVQLSKTVRVPAEKGAATLVFHGGERYLLHDDEAASGLAAKAFSAVDDMPARPAAFDAGVHAAASVLLPFVGGYGDAVSSIPVIREFARRFPQASLTVATTPGPRAIFEMADLGVTYERYPLTERSLRRFDAYLSLEGVETFGAVGPEGFPAHFARTMGVGFDGAELRFDLRPPAHPNAVPADEVHPRIALAVTAGTTIRDWPVAAQAQCVHNLAAAGAMVFLLGSSAGNVDWPDKPPYLTNLVGKTGDLKLLAAWVAQMDAVIATDSFIMHLAGAIGTPVVALFGPTSTHHAAAYSSARVLAGQAECAPCDRAVGACPKGFPACAAMQAESLTGAAVAAQSIELATRQ